MTQAQAIHFHSSDERFCGCKTQGRRFTLDENEVTCRECRDNDRLELSVPAKEMVARIEAGLAPFAA